MRVPQRLDYALRALVLLAMQPSGSVMSGAALASRLGLPARFVEQQMSSLASAGIVRSVRGAGGGYVLARPADDVSMADVVVALQGDIIDVPRVSGSAVSEAWLEGLEALTDSLQGITLASLARRQLEIEAPSDVMYYI